MAHALREARLFLKFEIGHDDFLQISRISHEGCLLRISKDAMHVSRIAQRVLRLLERKELSHVLLQVATTLRALCGEVS